MLTISASKTAPRNATVSDIPVVADGFDSLDPAYRRAAELHRFKAAPGETLVLAGAEDRPIEVLVGMGPAEKINAATLQRSAAGFVRAVGGHTAAATYLADFAASHSSLELGDAVQAVAEGLGLASYRYDAQKGSGTDASSLPVLRRVTIVASGKGVKAGLDVGKAVVQAVSLARDLTNEPGGSLIPSRFVALAKEAATAAGLRVTVWDEKRIAKEKLGGLLAVNKGSVHPPRFLMISYKPAKAKKSVALVGKGVTFDTGGLSLKTGAGMMTMKVDMGGAAAVLAAMTLLPALSVTNQVTAYIPLTDNMPSGDATRPGDVFTARNGKTVEVLNTDAEGRLILADALAVAAEAKPDVIIDIATLTGAVTAALGASFAGVMGAQEAVDGLVEAADVAGEKVWPLPLPADYRSQLDSSVADLRNIGTGPYGGALTAGLFLQEFVDDVCWGHVDLGLAVLAEADSGTIVKGATGAGTRLLAYLARDWGA